MACEHCRGSLSVPEKYGPSTVRCHWCGAEAAVPDEFRADPGADVAADLDEPFDPAAHYQLSGAEPAGPRTLASESPNVHRARFAGKEGAGTPLLDGDRAVTDDGPPTPYTVPGTGLKPCPECRGELPHDAAFCVHCGTVLVGDRAKVKRKYRPVDETWHDGWTPQFRRSLMLAALAVNAAIVLMGVAGSDGGLRDGDAWASVLASAAVPTFLQAFLLGTYGTLHVLRDRGGRVGLTRTWRFAFVPMAPKTVPMTGAAGTGTVAAPAAGFVGLMVCVSLFAIAVPLALIYLFAVARPGVVGTLLALVMFVLCFLPGVLFYFMVMRGARSNVALTDESRGMVEIVLRGRSVDDARDAAKVLADAAALAWHRAL